MATSWSQKLQQMVADKQSATALNGEILGQIPADAPVMQTGPQSVNTQWETPESGSVELTEGPPPWEMEDQKMSLSDARRFIECPQDAVLRWGNPKLIEQTGYEYWKPVTPQSDARFRLKIPAMLAVDGTVRRGGNHNHESADLLLWMPRSWVESRRKQFQEKTRLLTQSAIDKQDELRDDFRRGKYGPFVHLEEAKHPTHTMFEGRSVTDA